MSESAVSRRPSLPVLAMAGALIALAAAIATVLWASSGVEEAALAYAMVGSIPTAIVAIASIWIAIVALARRNRPRWMAVTALVISGVLAALSGFCVVAGLMLWIYTVWVLMPR